MKEQLTTSEAFTTLADLLDQELPEEFAMHIAGKESDRYLAIQETVEGDYDYTLYDERYDILDGGVYEDSTMQQAIVNILTEEGLAGFLCTSMDYDEVEENAQERWGSSYGLLQSLQ